MSKKRKPMYQKGYQQRYEEALASHKSFSREYPEQDQSIRDEYLAWELTGEILHIVEAGIGHESWTAIYQAWAHLKELQYVLRPEYPMFFKKLRDKQGIKTPPAEPQERGH